MRISRRILLAACFCGLGLGGAGASFLLLPQTGPGLPLQAASLPVEPVDYGSQNVVYHVSTRGHWRDRNSEAWRLVAFINNQFTAIEPDELKVEVVFHSSGIETLQRGMLDPKVGAAFDDLIKRGVRFRVCAQTLRSWGLGLQDLRHITQNDLVASASAWIVKMQKAGFGYIKL